MEQRKDRGCCLEFVLGVLDRFLGGRRVGLVGPTSSTVSLKLDRSLDFQFKREHVFLLELAGTSCKGRFASSEINEFLCFTL